ncbi:CHAT domain-containing protein [Synechocystis sp. LKSZ1]|uniref:CHAT domain-containing protein n=1 Tax=Synechocystis sp. LKSZ1 TaxID=3144951 RepID=UPI00336C1CAC
MARPSLRSIGAQFLLVLYFLIGLLVPPLFAEAMVKKPIQALAADQMIPRMETLWKGHYEAYFQRAFASVTLSGNQIAERLQVLQQETGKRMAVLWLTSEETELVSLVALPGRAPLGYHLPEANRAKVQQVSQAFIADLTRPSTRRHYLTTGKQLYDWIIAPIAPALEQAQIDTLIFCVGKGLRSVPFAALYDGQQFLVEKYGITRIPGFNLSTIAKGNLKNAQVLALGASEFQDKPALPGVATELETIAQIPWPGEFLLNQPFSIQGFSQLRQGQPFKIVHLATHADFLPGTPEQSYIQFGNRRLTLAQMGELNLNNPPVDLLVLSACQTAVGNEDAELGFSGLAIQAGVRSALASFWSVSDAGTLALMSEFYQRLHQTGDKAKALQETQKAMIRGEVYLKKEALVSSRGVLPLPLVLQTAKASDLSHPFYWAGFSLIGSPL